MSEDIKNNINKISSDEAIEKMQDWLQQNNLGGKKTNYKLKDWLVSRQRYWGTPIPIIYCDDCGKQPVSENQLPVLLPDNIENWEPKGGKSPLSTVEKWVDTYCPKCGKKAHRETDTMDTFVDSSWYFLRYTFEGYKKELMNYNLVFIGENKDYEIISSLSESVNGLHNFQYSTKEVDNNTIDSFEKLIDAFEHNVIILAKGYGAKIVNFLNNSKVKNKIIAIEDRETLNFYENEIGNFNLQDVIFISNLSSEILEKNAHEKGYKYFKLSGEENNFSDNEKELKDIIYFALLETVNNRPWDKITADSWLPVDNYVGGIEHATMHLLYARFFIKALNNLGYVGFDEPFSNLFTQGMITYKGAKMSKSKGNVVSPDDLVEQYGTDTVRCYILFMGPPEFDADWSDEGVVGINRWIQRIWNISGELSENQDQQALESQQHQLHKTIKKVKDDVLNKWQPNTAIASMMEFINFFSKEETKHKEVFIDFIRLLAPFAPFISDYLWEQLEDYSTSIFEKGWPEYDENMIKEEKAQLAVQFNGKMRGTLEVAIDEEKESVIEMVKNDEKFGSYMPENEPKKIIYVPGKIINIVA